MERHSISHEFLFAAAACRWPLERAADAVARRARAVEDWDRVVRIARRHRIEGMVWNAIRGLNVAVPATARAELSAAAQRIAQDNLRSAAESLRLDAMFTARGIDVLFVKGIALARLAYGSIGFKRSWDIDLLVLPSALADTARLLEEAGYALVTPAGADAAALARFHRGNKESVWKHATAGHFVELHTALVDNPLLLPGLDARGPAQLVEIFPGRTLRTLADDAQFAYLSVHGASSAWFRLKWLADLAALLAEAPSDEITRRYDQAVERGAGRAAAQGLLLAERFLGLALPADLRDRLARDRWNRWLADAAAGRMTGAYEIAELHDHRLATLPIHLTQFALLPGWGFPLAEARRRFAGLIDRFTAR